MNKVRSLIVVFLLLVSISIYGALQSWTYTQAVTTSAVTLTATVPYQQLLVVCDGADLLMKWNNAQNFFLVDEGTPFSFGSSDKITSLTLKTSTGTGTVYTAGLKTSTQPNASTW